MIVIHFAVSENEVFATVEEAGRLLGLSPATVWRRIRSGEIASVRRRGRRLVPRAALDRGGRRNPEEVPAMRADHPIFRLVGTGRSGGRLPGARDKHAVLAHR
jgi:excisionase family DNA binding protein